MNYKHKPVMLSEALSALNVVSGEWYIDATLGMAGHSKEILKRGGNVLGIDYDEYSLIKAEKLLNENNSDMEARYVLVRGNFVNLAEIASSSGINQVAGVLYDLGFSSDQMENPKYGLSFQFDAPLDMRLDQRASVSAADLVNALSAKELKELFSLYGDEKFSSRIANQLVKDRKIDKFSSTQDLVRSIEKSLPKNFRSSIHPATKVFQALRIAVNDEINNLKVSLPAAVDLLKLGGRLVVISFQSGEDRVVKHFIKDCNQLKPIIKKPVVPDEKEIAMNARARSAKLRVAEKI